MEEVNSYKYLGHHISNRNNNLVNIDSIRKKSIGITKKILNNLDNLKLGKYYFDCGLIFLNCLLRRSILYSAECYYNLVEKEIRILERIEEDYLRKLFKTEKGCPISQLYLESGLYPARFDIIKIQVLFYHYILCQEEDTIIFQFLEAQKRHPIKGDWIQGVQKNMKYINLTLSENELKQMNKKHLKVILTRKIYEKSLQYLKDLRQSKGKQIKYEKLKMAEYLMPYDFNLSIEDKRQMFSLKNRMVNIHENFPSKGLDKMCKAGCDTEETIQHIYMCDKYDYKHIHTEYEHIYNGTVTEQTHIYKIMKKKLEERNFRVIQRDPLYKQ